MSYVPNEVVVNPAQPNTPTEIWIDTDEPGSATADFVLKTGDTMTGPLTVFATHPVNDGKSLIIDGPNNKYRGMAIKTDGKDRWLIRANTVVETGGNAGSDFEIYARTDDEQTAAKAIAIRRSTGEVSVAADPTGPLGVATKQYVDAGDLTGTYGWAGANGFYWYGGDWPSLKCTRYGNLVGIEGMVKCDSAKSLSQGALLQIGTIGSASWRPEENMHGAALSNHASLTVHALRIDKAGVISLLSSATGTLAAGSWISINGVYRSAGSS